MLVDGKIAFVTGGAAGIGLALVNHLLACGSNVVSVDIAPESVLSINRRLLSERFTADRFLLLHADCGDIDELNSAFRIALQTFGRIDIVVNNAALPETGGDFHDTCRSKHVQEVLGVGLVGVVEGTRLGVQHMITRGCGGCIVNVASMGGLLPMPFSVVYSSAKHGVIGLSRSLYHMADPRMGGVRVNCVAPSFVRTSMVMDHLEISKGFKAAVNTNLLLHPEDIVEAIMRLIEDDSLAGAVLRVTPPPKNAKGSPKELHQTKFSFQSYPVWQQTPLMPPLPTTKTKGNTKRAKL